METVEYSVHSINIMFRLMLKREDFEYQKILDENPEISEELEAVRKIINSDREGAGRLLEPHFDDTVLRLWNSMKATKEGRAYLMTAMQNVYALRELRKK